MNPRLTSLPATAFKAVPIGRSGTPPGRLPSVRARGVVHRLFHRPAAPQNAHGGDSLTAAVQRRQSESWIANGRTPGHDVECSRRLASEGLRLLTSATLSARASPVATPSSSPSEATMTPMGSMIMLRPQ